MLQLFDQLFFTGEDESVGMLEERSNATKVALLLERHDGNGQENSRQFTVVQAIL